MLHRYFTPLDGVEDFLGHMKSQQHALRPTYNISIMTVLSKNRELESWAESMLHRE